MLLGLADNECIELPSKTFFFFFDKLHKAS